MLGYQDTRIYKNDYEQVFHTTLDILQSYRCKIKAANFKSGVILAFRGMTSDVWYLSWGEYIWVTITARENYSELKMYSVGLTYSWGQSRKNVDHIINQLDLTLQIEKEYIPSTVPSTLFPYDDKPKFLRRRKLSKAPRPIIAILIASAYPIYIFILISFLPHTEYNLPTVEYYRMVLIILVAGIVFIGLRLYKIGTTLSFIGSLLGTGWLSLLNFFAARDAWEYSKWKNYEKEQIRKMDPKQTIPKSFCPYCYSTLKGPAKYCNYCNTKFAG